MLQNANPGGGIVDSKHWATHCCGGEERGRGAERVEAAWEGRPGLCGAGHARLAARGRGVMGRDSGGGTGWC